MDGGCNRVIEESGLWQPLGNTAELRNVRDCDGIVVLLPSLGVVVVELL